MSSERVMVVALEDMATVGVVAAGAAQRAMEEDVSRLVLLHVLDPHVVANGFACFMGVGTPVVDTAEEGTAILSLAEAAISAEYGAVNRPTPEVIRRLEEGKPGAVIGRVAAEFGATVIVVGARRPHAFGRLTHPDVVEHLRGHTAVPVSIVALQADTSQAADTVAR